MRAGIGIWALWAVALLSTAGIQAESLPVRGTIDSRIRTALYQADQVYRLYGVVGYHLDLEFERGEAFLGLSAGDPEALIYSAHDNVLTLRPKAALVQMNITVTTTKRRYYFEYSAAEEHSRRVSDEVMYAVRFSYPPASGSKYAPTPAQRVDAELALAQAPHPLNVDYWYCGSPAIKPIAASDNGVQTRLTFGARSELPAVFLRNDDGSESLLNFSIDQGDVIIQRVAAKFIVRRGKLAGCVVNRAFVGGGERLQSGTITPAVTRERKEAKEPPGAEVDP